MAASDALVGEGLSISPWKEALAERDALKAVLVELCFLADYAYENQHLDIPGIDFNNRMTKVWVDARAIVSKEIDKLLGSSKRSS